MPPEPAWPGSYRYRRSSPTARRRVAGGAVSRPAAEVDGVLDLQMGNTREQVGRGAGTFSVKLQIQRRIPVGHRVQFLCEEGDGKAERHRPTVGRRMLPAVTHFVTVSQKNKHQWGFRLVGTLRRRWDGQSLRPLRSAVTYSVLERFSTDWQWRKQNPASVRDRCRNRPE